MSDPSHFVLHADQVVLVEGAVFVPDGREVTVLCSDDDARVPHSIRFKVGPDAPGDLAGLRRRILVPWSSVARIVNAGNGAL